MRTKHWIIQGTVRVLKVVSILTKHSQWFQFEPLPDGLYDITIKVELPESTITGRPYGIKINDRY
jgi:hypothetical protein